MIVSIDGIDCAGKTTAAGLLGKKEGTSVIKTPSSGFLREVKSVVDANPKDTLTRLVYYMSGVKDAIDSRTDVDWKGSNQLIIFDRFVYSTLTCHIALDEIYNNGKNVEIIRRIVERESSQIVTPDLAVFLYVDMDVRSLRLSMRDKTYNNNLDFDQRFAERTQSMFREIAQELRNRSLNVLEIDTTKLTTQQVSDAISSRITEISSPEIKHSIRTERSKIHR